MTKLYHSILPFDDQYADSTIHKWHMSDLQKDERSLYQLTHHNSSHLLHDNAFKINIYTPTKQILSTVSSRFLQYIHQHGCHRLLANC